eukprot:4708272-Alexandrium_andersonii.AAC.1
MRWFRLGLAMLQNRPREVAQPRSPREVGKSRCSWGALQPSRPIGCSALTSLPRGSAATPP